jgi:hypothetical protein
MMELSNGIRVIRGAFIQPTTTPLRPLVHAEIGWHGLQMRIGVHGGIPDKVMAKLLELFRQCHGPLNKVFIQGFYDVARARAIEQSIAAPRDPAEGTSAEIILHLLRLKKLSESFACPGRTKLATYLSEQAICLSLNMSRWDTTPWYTWPPEEDIRENAELFLNIILFGTNVNWLMTQIIDEQV